MSLGTSGSYGLGSRRNSRLGPDEARSRRSSMLRPGEDDMEEDEMIDPELRLRTVRTAGESFRSHPEQRQSDGPVRPAC
jgi:hypothetical protein